MNQEELKTYYGIYTDCWKLFKKYSEPTDELEFWQNLATECKELRDKYNNDSLAVDIILATYNKIETIMKKPH